jgi:hypothetical protein
MRARSRLAVALALPVALAAATTLAALEGCEAIVGGSLSDVPCVSGGCPTGQSCINGFCSACSGPSCQDGSLDVHVIGDEDASGSKDARSEDGRPPQDARDAASEKEETASLEPLGATCTSARQCESGVCGDSRLLAGLGLSGSVCTEPCCTSSDCVSTSSPGFVCYPSVGGNYCVDATLLKLTTLGGVAAGGGCSVGTMCRSGQCDTKTGTCEDACCTDSNCGGETCQYSVFEDGENYNCAGSGGSLGQGDDCLIEDCVSNLCPGQETEDPYCYAPCCQPSDCTGSDGDGNPTSCNWAALSDPDGGILWTRSCSETVNPDGGVGFGASCTTNDDCASELCSSKKTCTIPCCGTGNGTGGVCGAGVCGYDTFTNFGVTVDLQVCVTP